MSIPRRGAGMADMVPNKVEPTKLVGRAADDVTSEGALAQIAGNTDRIAAGGCDLGDHDVDPGFVNIDDRDRGAPAAAARSLHRRQAAPGSIRANSKTTPAPRRSALERSREASVAVLQKQRVVSGHGSAHLPPDGRIEADRGHASRSRGWFIWLWSRRRVVLAAALSHALGWF